MIDHFVENHRPTVTHTVAVENETFSSNGGDRVSIRRLGRGIWDSSSAFGRALPSSGVQVKATGGFLLTTARSSSGIEAASRRACFVSTTQDVRSIRPSISSFPIADSAFIENGEAHLFWLLPKVASPTSTLSAMHRLDAERRSCKNLKLSGSSSAGHCS